MGGRRDLGYGKEDSWVKNNSHLIVDMTEDLFKRIAEQYGIKKSIMGREWPLFLDTLTRNPRLKQSKNK